MKYIESRPHVVTCHDLLAVRSALGGFPEYKTRWSGRRLQNMILEGLSRARTIVCVSDATRADVMRLVPAGNRNLMRIYNGLNYPYAPMEREDALRQLRSLGLDPNRPFILHVGGNQWYKNREGVLEIFALLHKRFRDLRMVLAGKPWTAEMRRLVWFHGLEDSAIELVDVREEDLRALYSRAEALLFPSLEEGFGWPVAEAQACGCPVVTSNRAPMTEVGGAVATYIDPLNHESAADAVTSVLGSHPDGSERRHTGATRFSTAAMVDGYLALYGRLLRGNASSGAGELRLRCA
jgi:glycosyltransferase involved in cell wall biosynthesis